MEIGSIIKEIEDEDKCEGEDPPDLKELKDKLPLVYQRRKESGHLQLYIQWYNLTAEDEIPRNNISFLLFLDTVEWFSCKTTSEMRYIRPETKKFWEVGYRLFKGKFLRYMGGPRNAGQVVDGSEKRGNVCRLRRKSTLLSPH
ncbi:hypothetical protein DPMN_177682 [Dreissena polymorpha]|uniref:Uncharacterized protein n=1 Tax=Dreissena polymorpha TaxID=45954 RepID=A0A9D4E9G4_DREPO|nr:hypothetical protein DPMN_177682 [Dreissena polymorpha]